MRRLCSLAALCAVVVLVGADARLLAAQPAASSAATRLVVFEDFTRFT